MAAVAPGCAVPFVSCLWVLPQPEVAAGPPPGADACLGYRSCRSARSFL